MWDRWSAIVPMGFADHFQGDATLFKWHNVQAEARLEGLEGIQEFLSSLIFLILS